MKKIAILGTGGFARELVPVIKDINKVVPTYDFCGFVDGSIEKGALINGYPVIGSDEDINATTESISLVLAFGEPNLKQKVFSKFDNPLIDFPTIIHPSVWIGEKDYVEIGKGCIICAGTMITANVKLSDFITLNLGCTVGHDTQIGSFSSFMPSVNISGEVNIGFGVYVGTGAKIINQIQIGEHTIIGAGAVVAKSLPSDCTAVGIPAKPIKFHIK